MRTTGPRDACGLLKIWRLQGRASERAMRGRAVLPDGTRKNHCAACGGLGHQLRTCPERKPWCG